MSEQKRLDRPDREKIINIIQRATMGIERIGWSVAIDQLLALFEPLIEEAKQRGYDEGYNKGLEKGTRSIRGLLEEARKQNTEQIDAMLVEARRTAKTQERERIAEMVLKDAQTSADFPSFHTTMVAWACEALKEGK